MMMSSQSPVVESISECFVKPIKESPIQICNLAPWDIQLLSLQYMQSGLLLKKPNTRIFSDNDFMEIMLAILKHSLSLALVHFYPLAGRLVTRKTENPSSYTVYVDCNNGPGARFIHAKLDMTVSDILSPVDVPPIVHSFFDHHKAMNHDGHTMPLVSIKVTELVDGLFVGCSMNHAVSDGTSFFHFLASWMEIIEAQAQAKAPLYDVPISRPPIHNRWFPDGCSPFINLPFKHEDEFISRYEAPKLRVRIFHFSADSVQKLKEKANWESQTTKISSLQALAGHVWRCVTRARNLAHDQRTCCKFFINNRSRMDPPLSSEYFGNAMNVVIAESKAGEVLEHDLGWAAWKMHVAVANHNNNVVQGLVNNWLEHPVVHQLSSFIDPYSVGISASPRFNPYAKSNVWNLKGLAIMSGYNNKFDGCVRSYAAYEGEGSINFEVCLLPHVMTALESDQEFMQTISPLLH